MLHRPLMIGMIAFCGILGAGMVSPAAAAPPASNLVAKSDTDSEQTLTLAEVKTAASARFDKLDKDADGTLDSKEVTNLIGPKTFKAADPDNDGTLSKDEYLALVETLFKKADIDHDGTLSVTELKSDAAKTLRRLIQ
jgi:Ca2+-binding EF-hand superfamily protein